MRRVCGVFPASASSGFRVPFRLFRVPARLHARLAAWTWALALIYKITRNVRTATGSLVVSSHVKPDAFVSFKPSTDSVTLHSRRVLQQNSAPSSSTAIELVKRLQAYGAARFSWGMATARASARSIKSARSDGLCVLVQEDYAVGMAPSSPRCQT